MLPRGYLSWSQLQLFRSNKAQYIKKYIDGEEYDLDNSGLRFGKRISELLEGLREPETDSDHMLLNALTRYQHIEYTRIVDFDTKYGVVKLLVRIDTFSDIDWAFREYKTGRVSWTQKKANDHGQNTFYSLALYLDDKRRRIPTSHLDWIETIEEDGEVRMTGKIVPFKNTKNLIQIMEMASEITKVAQEIDALMRKKINSIL